MSLNLKLYGSKMLNYLKQCKLSFIYLYIYSLLYKMLKSTLTWKVITTTLGREESCLFHSSNPTCVNCMDVPALTQGTFRLAKRNSKGFSDRLYRRGKTVSWKCDGRRWSMLLKNEISLSISQQQMLKYTHIKTVP